MLDSIEIGFVLKVIQIIVIVSMMVTMFFHFRLRKLSMYRLSNYVQIHHPQLWVNWQYDPMKMGKNTVLINIQQWCADQKTQQHSDEQLETLKRAYLDTEAFSTRFSVFFLILILISSLLS